MAFNVSTFFTRLGSAAVFSAIMLTGLLWTPWAFLLLFFIVNVLCLREYARLCEKILDTPFTRQEKANMLAAGMALYAFLAAAPISSCGDGGTGLYRYFFYTLGLTAGFLILFFSFRRTPKAVYLLTGLSYISLSLGLLAHVRFQSPVLPVMLVLFIWMNDTMAYLTGSFFGKTPFFPSISPKKTIEGTVGGIIFTMAFAAVWGYFTTWFPLWQWLVWGGIAALAGTAGDLAESKLKRLAGVKDSGEMMPGHGGALDRFDSLLFAAPVAYLFALLCMACDAA
jgi:phosphatidate cytidylyltransferase